MSLSHLHVEEPFETRVGYIKEITNEMVHNLRDYPVITEFITKIASFAIDRPNDDLDELWNEFYQFLALSYISIKSTSQIKPYLRLHDEIQDYLDKLQRSELSANSAPTEGE